MSFLALFFCEPRIEVEAAEPAVGLGERDAGGSSRGSSSRGTAVGAEAVELKAVAGGGSWRFFPLRRPRTVGWVFFNTGILDILTFDSNRENWETDELLKSSRLIFPMFPHRAVISSACTDYAGHAVRYAHLTLSRLLQR